MSRIDSMQISIIKNKANELFERLGKTDNEDSKEKIVRDYELQKYMIDRNKYPEILFNIKKEDIIQLIKNNIIDNDYNIRPDVASSNESIDVLSKLLYAVLWKNGDLGKEHNVIKGIIHKSEDLPDSGIVFYQFGKYLADHNEPIIDQHVIRCFLIKKEDQLNLLNKYILLEEIDKSYNQIIMEYRIWVNETIEKGKYSKKDIDEVLFAFGRYIKKEGRKLTTAST